MSCLEIKLWAVLILSPITLVKVWGAVSEQLIDGGQPTTVLKLLASALKPSTIIQEKYFIISFLPSFSISQYQ